MDTRNKRRFNPGDRCVIRQWEDMEAEYGLVGEIINCEGHFYPSMRYLCGKPFTIASVGADIYGGEEEVYYNSLERFEFDDFGFWCITGDMLEYAEGREFKPESYDSLESL